MVYEHQAQYYETDQMGIIHHSNYIRWMESARVWWLEEIGAGYAGMESIGIVSPVLSVSCQYHSMVHFGDIVFVEPHMEKYNGIRLEFSYRITDKATGELRAEGASSHCFMDREGHILALQKDYPEYDRILRSQLS